MIIHRHHHHHRQHHHHHHHHHHHPHHYHHHHHHHGHHHIFYFSRAMFFPRTKFARLKRNFNFRINISDVKKFVRVFLQFFKKKCRGNAKSKNCFRFLLTCSVSGLRNSGVARQRLGGGSAAAPLPRQSNTNILRMPCCCN